MIVRSADYGSNGQIRLDGAWMAGFHFNSAIMRLSAVYHRFLRVITNNHQKGEWVDDLLKQLTYPWRVFPQRAGILKAGVNLFAERLSISVPAVRA